MAKPTKDAEWATGAADIVEPTLGQKQLGWVTGTKPPNGWFNWWMNLIHLWIVWLDSKFVDGSSGNRVGAHGIDSTGVGAAQIGVAGVGGTAGGVGVHGTGDGIGEGVLGVGDTGGAGVRGFSLVGYGLVAQGDGSSPAFAAFRIIPQDTAPTTGAIGDCYVSTAGILFICTNSVGPVWTKVGLQV